MTRPRIPYPALEELTPHARAQLARRPPVNLYRMVAHAPGLIEPFMSMVLANFNDLSLPTTLREAVILRVGAHHHSEYEIHHHRIKAREAGLGEACIEALLGMRPPPEIPPLGLPAADLVDAITFTDHLLRERPVDDRLVGRLVETHGRRGYVELSMLVGFYRMVASFLEATGIEPESADVPAR